MSWNGSGVFTRTNGVNNGETVWSDDKAQSVKIVATRHDTHDQDLASGINNCLAKDGQNAMTGNLDLGTFNIENLGELDNLVVTKAGTNRVDFVSSGNGIVQVRLKTNNSDDRRLIGLSSADAVESQVVLDNASVLIAGANSVTNPYGEFSATGLDLQGNTLSNCDVTATTLTATTVNGIASIQNAATLNGGSTGQYLRKDSGADQDFSWQTLTPSAVADNFQAYMDNSQTLTGTDATLTDWVADINEGTAYSFVIATGVLTINTTGTYMFTWKIFMGTDSAPASGSVQTAIYKNGTIQSVSTAHNYIEVASNSVPETVTGHCLLQCTATDTITLRARNLNFLTDTIIANDTGSDASILSVVRVK